jgi:hypothetical protein
MNLRSSNRAVCDLLLLVQVNILRTDSVTELSSEQLVEGINTLLRAIAPRQEEINKRLTQPARTNTGHTVCSSTRKCAYCGTTSTPMWRRGPENYTNLCNSCGVKWRRGKIVLSSGDNRLRLWKSSGSATAG